MCDKSKADVVPIGPLALTNIGPSSAARKSTTSSGKFATFSKLVVPERAPFRHGLVLALLCTGFATIVAITTYYLNQIANTPIFFGTILDTFSSNPKEVPIGALLQGSGVLAAVSSGNANPPSLIDLYTTSCADAACAASFAPTALAAWTILGNAFALIPNFDQPAFQDPNQVIKFSHINNLAGKNTPLAQFYIDGMPIAITCMIRRANFYLTQQAASTAVNDALAFCSQRTYDANWGCENEVGPTVNTYVLQMNKGTASFVGVVKRNQVYMNAGRQAELSGGLSGGVFLQSVPGVDEYQRGVVQASAPWDVLAVTSCATLNPSTNSGWLVQMQGVVTMTWKCDSLMLTNSIVLWVMTLYLVLLQTIFLRRSVICVMPVYMSKNVVGAAILFVAFWGNENLQALSTFLRQNPVVGFNTTFYALCGAAQIASIVGIMTGTAIQIWFNPLIVTQTWLLLAFSLVNWVVVFVLEGFVFPYASENTPTTCALTSSTNCYNFSAISNTYFVSAIVCGFIVLLAILTIYYDAYRRPDPIVIAAENSMLQYLTVSDFSTIATTTRGCSLVDSKTGATLIDEGVLLIKNMLHVSNSNLTRLSNVQYEVIFRFIPTRLLKRLFSETVGSILIYNVVDGKITGEFTHKFLHEMEIGAMDKVTGYIS
ncbi:hypothetical protein SPRG_00442 [Saprolegnia parasitica CBS 223.65]|uniref:Transmembrane protein n=1 Tax=Saprolegnia parasitica (strain CBS 223.65) TaxID=695850 RepID=A0A067D283_SAPPC|nr:hypothetical protein SPRG_00442 [Saprolegnia parasitica CBS 223.65]KDO35600.1 hypothetical protein SPRG_00442 [Saprolegnia parasitica CBS 223.65]|eukprot:XP_012193931.1 hypothetical protein SPRG_00442 [Saprolegnia parasitica CBS 223.65]